MAKYKDLTWKFPLHFLRFTNMINRAKDLSLECEFKKVYDDFNKFIEIMGSVPEGMERPSVGRLDHSKGYVFDTESDRWNFQWQSMSDNGGEAIRRYWTDGGHVFSEDHKNALSEAAKHKFQTTLAAQHHSNKMKEIWTTDEGRKKFMESTTTPEAIQKRSTKMKAHWRDEEKREHWKKALSQGQKNAWENGRRSASAFTEMTFCPHCGRVGKLAPMKRWHFDNCKSRNVSV